MTERGRLTLDGKRFALVLSSGRTGTTFLAETLQEILSNAIVVQEPPTSRRQHILFNMAAAGVIPHRWPKKWFLRSRSAMLENLDPEKQLIEINPFLGEMAQFMPESIQPLRMIHMVRDPLDWVLSAMTFKAYSWRKYIVEWLPFAQITHPAVRRQWGGMTPFEQYAWRWRLGNEQIAACSKEATSSLLVKYEDLFSDDTRLRQNILMAIIDVLAMGDTAQMEKVRWEERANPSLRDRRDKEGVSERERRIIADICGPLSESFGYTSC